MEEKEQQLKEEVMQLLEQARAADEEEDLQYGSQRGDQLPEELQRRETRLARIQEAPQALQQRARDKAAAEGKSPAQAQPEDKDQYNFTDPESRIMKGADGIVQGYNAQAAVEPTLLLIVGQTVTEASNDKKQLLPMIELIEHQSGQRPEAILADNGYCSEENLDKLESADPSNSAFGSCSLSESSFPILLITGGFRTVLTQLTVPALLDRIENLVDSQILLPCTTAGCVVASTGSVQSEKTGQPIGTELTSEHFESMTFKLLIRHCV